MSDFSSGINHNCCVSVPLNFSLKPSYFVSRYTG